MNIVRPVRITSPISGEPVAPKISERRFGNRIYTECTWNDPKSGHFIRKGIVKICDATTGADITNELTDI
tara:strand:- start:909 stop:1118 length:210 start_codon:yes stop_codon:yes gene_type:complete